MGKLKAGSRLREQCVDLGYRRYSLQEVMGKIRTFLPWTRWEEDAQKMSLVLSKHL